MVKEKKQFVDFFAFFHVFFL